MKRLLLSLLLFPILAMGMEIDQQHISAPGALGAIKLLRTDHGFSVLKNNVEREVKSHDIDPVLKRLNREQLVNLLASARIRVTQFDNEDYKLALAGCLKGGGPILAWIAYSTTKTLCYGVGVAAAGAAVASTGGAVGAVAGPLACFTTLGATAPAALVGAGITQAGLGTAAGLTAGAATSAGSFTAIVGAIEALSLGAGALGAMIPFL